VKLNEILVAQHQAQLLMPKLLQQIDFSVRWSALNLNIWLTLFLKTKKIDIKPAAWRPTTSFDQFKAPLIVSIDSKVFRIRLLHFLLKVPIIHSCHLTNIGHVY
jgi:hypothetical protein